MYNIIVFSDTHGNSKQIAKIKPIIDESDLVIFLGDGCAEVERLADCKNKIIITKGNCDLYSRADEETVREICGKCFLICHGHKYHVKTDLLKLSLRAHEAGADYVLFGHTHCMHCDSIDGITYINPGSLSLPRQGVPSYYYMSQVKDGFVGKHVELI